MYFSGTDKNYLITEAYFSFQKVRNVRWDVLLMKQSENDNYMCNPA